LSERYRITVHYGDYSVTFKTKTRVGDVEGLEHELKNHTDWKGTVEAAQKRLNMETMRCPRCGFVAHVSSTVVSCTKCNWVYVPLQIPSFEKEQEE
jgi:ribosomal protein S27AE